MTLIRTASAGISFGVLISVLLFSGRFRSAETGAVEVNEIPLEAVLAEPSDVTAENVAAWKKEGFQAVAIMLDDQHETALLQKVSDAVAAQSLELYYWIEVGRSPTLAHDHPEWMASLGVHDDWRNRFPHVRLPEAGEVAKVWPWVPISYQEAFDAQLARVRQLINRLPQGYRGLLLNDLQGGPSACGCGNLQCRWAVDYHVPSGGTKRENAAGDFVREIRRAADDREVIPVWVTECSHEDLPIEKQRPPGTWSTELCGSVDCFDNCTRKFAEQWSALHAVHHGQTGILLLHREFQRVHKEYNGPGGWISKTMNSLDGQITEPFPRQRFWLVIQGYDVSPDETLAARRAAAQLNPRMVLVAHSRIDQSWEPRIVQVKAVP